MKCGAMMNWAYDLKSFILTSIVIFATLFVVACGNNTSVQDRDHAPAKVLNYPEGFPNVAIKCDGYGHRVYSQDKGGGGVAVINDQSCLGGTRR